jgi:8-oxo-dGTP pyrophosphatase MutT (NUDIX family)
MILPDRPAAKALLFVPNGEIVVASNRRGMLSLLGGGIDDGETAGTAVLRELDEEAGITIDDLERPLELMGSVEGSVSTRRGIGHTASWEVFYGQLRPGVELSPRDADIVAIQTIRPEAAAAMCYPVISGLASCAIRRFGVRPLRSRHLTLV